MFVSIDHVVKDFRKKPGALRGLTLDLPFGMIGLLGANGAGKTTLMRLVCGIIQPTRGRITVDGANMAERGVRKKIKRHLGYLPQHIEPYPNLTPLEFLDYVGVLKGIWNGAERKHQAHTLVAQMGLEDVKERRIGGLSGGMRRRVGIAQALVGDPRLLIVDEPTAGLDPEERMRFRSLLATLGHHRTVILSTHILDDVAQTCPFVVVLRAGQTTYEGPTHRLVDAARGRTWITTSQSGEPPAGAAIVNATSTAAGVEYRIVTDTPPADSIQVEPRLEDGYLALATTTAADRT